MTPAFSPFLALRYLLSRRINLLGMLGVMFSVWAVLVVDSVFTGFVSDIRQDVRRSAPDLLVTALPHDTDYRPLRQALEAERDLVVATAPRLRHDGLFQPLQQPERFTRPQASADVDFNHMESGFAMLVGIDPLREVEVVDLRAWLADASTVFARRGGDIPASRVLDEPDADRRELLLQPDAVEWAARGNAGLDREARVEDYKSQWPGLLLGWKRLYYAPWLRDGDPVDLLCPAFVPRGDGGMRLRPHRVRLSFAGYFRTGHRIFDETSALLPIETLRTALGQDSLDPRSIELVTDVAIRVRPEVTGAALAAAKVRLQGIVQKLLPAGAAPCAVYDWEEQNSVFLSAVAHEQAMMQFVLFVVMLVAAFVIYATLHMMVTQKIKDIGILAALGGTPRGIGAVFLLCGGAVGLVGSGLGALLGTLTARHLNDMNAWLYAQTGLELFPRQLFDLAEIPVHLTPSWTAQVAIGSLLLALLVAFLPARKASRIHPVTALAYE